MDAQINLSAEKAGARYGTGVRDKHWCMMSMVENRMAPTVMFTVIVQCFDISMAVLSTPTDAHWTTGFRQATLLDTAVDVILEECVTLARAVR
jgi:hypothetical protein